MDHGCRIPPPYSHTNEGHTVGGGQFSRRSVRPCVLTPEAERCGRTGEWLYEPRVILGGRGLLHPAVGTGGSSCRVQPTPGIWLVGLTGAFFVSMHTGSCTTHDAYVDMLNIFGSAYSRTRSEHAAPQCPSGDTRSLAMRTCATELKNTYM